MFVKVELNNIVLETCVQGEISRGESNVRDHALLRHQFVEVLIRFAIFTNCNAKAKTGNNFFKSSPSKKSAPVNPYEMLTPSQAFYLFIENKVKPLHKKLDI